MDMETRNTCKCNYSSEIAIHLIAIFPLLLDITETSENFWSNNKQWKSDRCMKSKVQKSHFLKLR